MATKRPRRTAPKSAQPIEQALVCLPRRLPSDLLVNAARIATEVNPVNHPPINRLAMVHPGFNPTPMSIAVLTTKYWHGAGVQLTVGFLDNPPSSLRTKILSHMNAWSKTTNVKFVYSNNNPQVRIARIPGDGYWSYLGTDILSIEAGQPTMNLDSFTMGTPESEFTRVVRHETGHTLGCPHEHMREALVNRIDVNKAIAFFGATQGWDADMVRRQVLTPLEQSSLLGTEFADQESIMCYQIPGTLTVDGKPILGGLDINQSDYAFMAKVYPKSGQSIMAASGIAAAKKGAAGKTTKKGKTKGGGKGSAKRGGKSGAKRGSSAAKKGGKGKGR